MLNIKRIIKSNLLLQYETMVEFEKCSAQRKSSLVSLAIKPAYWLLALALNKLNWCTNKYKKEDKA